MITMLYVLGFIFCAAGLFAWLVIGHWKSQMDAELKWCPQCQEWMYGTECEGSWAQRWKYCGRWKS